MTNEELENRLKEMNDLENINASSLRQKAEKLLKIEKSKANKVLSDIDTLK